MGCMAQGGTYSNYAGNHKVTGGVGIVQFVKAVLDFEEVKEEDWDDPSSPPFFDKPNGYFHWSWEGAGGGGYTAAYWNRSDGKKMFIVGYYEHNYTDSKVFDETTDWYKLRSYRPKGQEGYDYTEAGVLAFLYNPATQTLEQMQKPPFNKVPKTDDIMEFYPPQKGKDIKVTQYKMEENWWENQKEHTLKFNGLTFDWVE